MAEKRNEIFDTARGIGILFVVVGHVFIDGSMLYVRQWIYSFHMPLFFVISGYFLNPGKDNFQIFLIKKVRSLLVPYFSFAFISYLIYLVGYYVMVVVLNQANIEHLKHGVLKPFIGIFFSKIIDGYMNFNMPLWYLTCLFVALIIYYFISKTIRNDYVRFLMVLSLSVLSYFVFTASLYLPWGIDTALIAILFLESGHLMKKYNVVEKIINNYLYLIVFVILSVVLSLSNSLVVMAENTYGNYFYFLVSSIAGIIFIIFISSKIENVSLLKYFGEKSLIILVTHNIYIYIFKSITAVLLKKDLSFINSNFQVGGVIFFMTMLMMFPTIFIIEKFLPFLIGRRKVVK